MSWAEARKAALAHFARGDALTAKLSDIMDEAIVALIAPAIAQAPLKSKVALVATGGYGRGQLAPLSDIDLLILHQGVSNDTLKTFVNALLYPLWDAGLVVGHVAHSPSSAMKFAETDMTAMTAFLDARFIAGDMKLFKEFASRFDILRWRTKTRFVKAKRAELEARHDQSAQSRYLAEPDLKDGKGSLRDIHVIEWIHRGLYGKPLTEASKRGGIFRPEDIASLRRAERFLLSLRSHLHDIRGRADERLSFDVQPALAERLGYAARADISAAERMMKHYFVTAVEIGRLTRIFWARLEEENAKLLDRAPTALPKILSSDEVGKPPNLRIKNGRLDFASGAAASRTPLDLFRYFRAFAKKPEIDFHPDALALISKNAPVVTSEVRRDPEVAKIFLATITTAKDPVKLLRVMSETGLLGRYIPSFGQITGRIQYGLYRRFSLDEHIFQSIGFLTRIRLGELVDEHPIATRILERAMQIEDFYVAVLLHEAGWSLKKSSADNAEALVSRVARRLGAGETAATHIAWCAARPLLMVRIAERRNLSEAKAISTFAAEVASSERLDLLLVLTVCHLRAVSDSAWNELTRRQIAALYHGAKTWLSGGEAALARWMTDRAVKNRVEVEEKLADWPRDERAAFISRLPGQSLATIEPHVLARAASLARSADKAGVAATIRDDAVEAIVYAKDRPGLLADLAGAVASADGNVRSMHAITLDDGGVIDVFTVMPPNSAEPGAAADFVRTLHSNLLAAARSKPTTGPSTRRRIGDRRTIFSVPTDVRLDSQVSDEALVVEAEGRDRPGLLHSLTSAISEMGLIIRSAHIATYGERAIDAFYLQNERGQKIDDMRVHLAIRKKLLAVLAEPPTPRTKTAD
ncbi:MAG: [protein-PII] uridylyltransferase [Parvularculaceae bacterium]|nr:[protein-PII] uridylyltransferase [Parvularculaceae bacterium]